MELLTKKEREAQRALHRQKQDRIAQVEPDLLRMMRQLNAPYRLILKGPNKEVMRTIDRRGGGVRIVKCTIGNEIIIDTHERETHDSYP